MLATDELVAGVCATCRASWAPLEWSHIRVRARAGCTDIARRWIPWTPQEERMLMHMVQEMTHREIASTLGRSVGGVRDRLYRVMYPGRRKVNTPVASLPRLLPEHA